MRFFSRQEKETIPLRLIVGLGNPGKEYALTRHNMGFLVVQRLAEQFRLKFHRQASCQGMVAENRKSESPFLLLLPLTFMNHSGIAVKKILNTHSVGQEHILVVCDDWNLDFGQLRIRRQGSAGGHHGLESIIERVGSNQFPRLRVGIGAPFRNKTATDYVLAEMTSREQDELDEVLNAAADCCQAWLTQEFAKVMNQFNKRMGDE
jgi:peptidyl-tRNA hydrolase, PTH1 family